MTCCSQAPEEVVPRRRGRPALTRPARSTGSPGVCAHSCEYGCHVGLRNAVSPQECDLLGRARDHMKPVNPQNTNSKINTLRGTGSKKRLYCESPEAAAPASSCTAAHLAGNTPLSPPLPTTASGAPEPWAAAVGTAGACVSLRPGGLSSASLASLRLSASDPQPCFWKWIEFTNISVFYLVFCRVFTNGGWVSPRATLTQLATIYQKARPWSPHTLMCQWWLLANRH